MPASTLAHRPRSAHICGMVDLRNSEFLQDPGPVLAQMRADGPLVRTRLPLIGPTWLTTTDAAARALLKDEARFARDPKDATGKTMIQTYWWLPRRIAPLMDGIILKDGADHARLRALVSAAFARTAMDDLRPAIAARADALLDRLPTDRPVDLVAGYSKALPFEVICDLLGFREADLPYLRRAVAPISGAGSGPAILWALLRIGGLMTFLRSRLRSLRDAPGRGLMSDLVHASEGADRLTEDEQLAMVMMLFLAGHETTVHLLNDCLLTLVDRPELREGLFDRVAMPLFIEEAMRFWTPAMLTKFHFARADCTFEGVALKRGERVGAFLLAANHDPVRVEGADRFNASRRPNAHLGFGFGPHVCLGMQLARVEVDVGLTRLLERFPDYALDGPRPRWLRRIGLRGPEALRVRLRP